MYHTRESTVPNDKVYTLLNQIRDNVRIKEEDMVQVAMSFGKGIITLLLGLKRDRVLVTKEVVKAVARNRNSGKEVMALLLDQRGDEVQITEEVAKAAATNEMVLALLLDRRGGEVR
ncbi:hypothetical protein G7Y89_g7057 [Cudoniella acicularis]|uniref:Uncharacterized protein n=1 Tax=Cudoniella acicularis TaxID=354080 RepID=A0A8H4W2B0_9HELO|nr:hypothetical protein G7Y89_g7057 [Cudoniella acicularis]